MKDHQLRSTARKPTQITSRQAENSFNDDARDTRWLRGTNMSTSPFADQKRSNIKALERLLAKQPELRLEEDLKIILSILKEENCFNEFHNDINIFKKIAKTVRSRYQPAQSNLLVPGQRDEQMYKLLNGEVTVKKQKDNQSKAKSKNQFMQSMEEFKEEKDFQVHCKQDCFFLVINYSQYCELSKRFQENKKIKQLLAKTSLFGKLKRKQMAYLLSGTEQTTIRSKEGLFFEGEENTQRFYFVIDGEISIQKKSVQSFKHQLLCTICSGSIFGEEGLFQQSKRTYSAVVRSSYAHLLVLNVPQILNMITLQEIGRDSLLTQSYKNYLQMKENHYLSKAEENVQVKSSFHQSRNHKMSPIKQLQMSTLLRGIQNNADKLSQKEKLFDKRQNVRDGSMISVQSPLFSRQNLPGLKQYGKKVKSEMKSKDAYKLPTLN